MRNRHFLLLDILLLMGIPALATTLRYPSLGIPASTSQALLWYSLLVLPMRIGVAFGFGLYRCMWRYASIGELQRIMFAWTTSTVASAILGTVGIRWLGLATVRLPLSSLVLDALLTLGAFATPRLLDRFVGRRQRTEGGRRAIIVGAGAAGQMILRETRLNDRLHVTVVGFVDDDLNKQKLLLGGVQVVGQLDDLPALISRLGADELIIAMPGARGSAVRRVVQAATEAGIPARTMPGLHDLISGRVKVSSLRRVQIEDLLRREPIVTDLDAVRELAANRVVLVTGAGGSIGSELCRQIAALAPSSLIALDHSENQIFEIERELKRYFPLVKVVPVIADIRDTHRIHKVIGRFQPHAIFHAAAHKHVPLMEENVIEAITNNILGTRNIVDAALDADTKHLVSISTDKAVRPTSIMGATKRVAEKILLHAAVTEKRNFVSVRFGNVLGSRGSVIPTFVQQIQEGGPVKVTHPEMRRYFMTIPEAVQLVLQAGALGQGGELFVLDMGEPIKIVDLARDLIRLSGLEEGSDIEIEYSGVRPGEKLYEEVLFGGEDVRTTNHPKVLRAVGDMPEHGIADRVEALIRAAIANPVSDRELRDGLRLIVPEFATEDARTDPRLTPISGQGVVSPIVYARPTLAK